MENRHQPAAYVNSVDRALAEIALLGRRVVKLEQVQQLRLAAGADDVEAQRLAQELGFEIALVVLPKTKNRKPAEVDTARRELGCQLHFKNRWSASRIARALNVCERTVERWIA